MDVSKPYRLSAVEKDMVKEKREEKNCRKKVGEPRTVVL